MKFSLVYFGIMLAVGCLILTFTEKIEGWNLALIFISLGGLMTFTRNKNQ